MVSFIHCMDLSIYYIAFYLNIYEDIFIYDISLFISRLCHIHFL